ncbi:MAG: hypothetical protein LBJ24_04070 [Treponema sp.]|jgi:hypothetical protein|nr:hypothetical protein [Treponema sp.]
MKKNFVLLAACVVFAVAACKSAPIVFDPAVPRDQQTALYINKGIAVTSYNGIPVRWKNKTNIFLPAGDMELIVDVDTRAFVVVSEKGKRKKVMRYQFTGTGVPFNYRFEAGQRYNLYFGAEKERLHSGGIRLSGYPINQERNRREKAYRESTVFVPFSKTQQLKWKVDP